MKVFTVGLDQKPRDEDSVSTTTTATEKNGVLFGHYMI
jgi:hypothetical protein